MAAALPGAGPDVGEPAKFEPKLIVDKHKHTRWSFPKALKPTKMDKDCVPQLMHVERGDSMWELGGVGGRTETSICWTATAWPTARESFFAAALVQISDNLDWWEAQWYSKALLEPLTPLRDMGLMLLVVGLAAKEPGEHGLAVDAAIQAIEDGRLGSDNFGRALQFLLPHGLVKPARWAKTFAEVARVSDRHAAVVKLALEQCLDLVAEPPRDFAKLLGLLNELCVQLKQPVSEAHRAHPDGVKGSNKVAKLAKTLRSFSADDGGAAMRRAVRQLAQQRFEIASGLG